MTKKSFYNAPWDFHASLNFGSMLNFGSSLNFGSIFLVSSALRNSLNGVSSFNGRKDIHKKCSEIHYF